MVKDYFQDIVPPESESHQPRTTPIRKVRIAPAVPQEAPSELVDSADEYIDDDISSVDTAAPVSRGIRNINMPPRPRSRAPMGDMREQPSSRPNNPLRARRSFSSLWIWLFAFLCVVAIGFLGLFLFRKTTITLSPRTQSLTFDQTAQFTAYPASTAATGTLPYTVITTDITDSASVQGNGSTSSQMKATGTIHVYNAYSASSVRLIKNTRFQTSTGMIFRTPSDIVVPGKKGSVPGTVDVTVVADQAGQEYNIAPTSRFTVPGLQSNASMYAGIYAQSSSPMTGGFSGTQTGVSESVRQAAISDIRGRIAQKVLTYVQSQNTAIATVLPGLAQVTYTDAPDVDGQNSQVQINETAHVQVPVFSTTAFTAAVAQALAVDTGGAPVTLLGGAGYNAQMKDTATVALGNEPIDFSLVGSATFIWSIDSKALTLALAGRDQSVFQTVIGGFPGIEAARARIEPFWKNSFPSDPSKITVIIQNVGSTSVSSSQ
jgi:hypothetical protein